MRIRGLSVAIVGVLSLASGISSAASFTSGNVVVLRVGTGVGTLTGVAAASFLDEINPTTGAVVQSIALPVAAAGDNNICTMLGTSNTEGQISNSSDGAFVVGGCYQMAPAGAVVGTTPRVAFRVSSDGIVDTITETTDITGNPRGVTSDNGTNFWFGTSGQGIRHAGYGTTPTVTTSVSSTFTNVRSAQIFGGQLFISSGAGALRLGAVGAGMPISAGNTTTSLPGLPTSGNAFNSYFFADLDAGTAGNDTLYVADEVSGIRKYSLVAGAWTAPGVNPIAGSGASAYRGLTARVSGGTVTLYATRRAGNGAAGGGEFAVFTDSNGYNTGFSSVAEPAALTTAATNTAFRGVALVPQAAGATPVLSITAAPTISEGNPGCVAGTNKLIFPVTASPAPGAELAFTATITGGSATAPTDIGTLAIVNVNAGGNGSVEVPVNCDLKIEGNETVEVTLQDGAAYDLNAGSTVATATINNDDLGEIFITSVAQAEGTGANSTFAFNVNLGGGVLAGAGGVSVNYDVVAAGATPATITTDFTGASATLTILEDTNSGVLNVTVIADSDDEPDETFAVNLSSPVNATIGDNQGLGTIQNDDSVIPQISINDVGVTEGNSGITNAVFTVTINPAPVGTVTVDYATADGITNPANVGVDFTNTIGNLSFDALNTSRQISVPVVGETSVELDETYFVNLSNIIGSAAFAGGDAQGLGTITNDDFNVVLSIPTTLSIAEGNSDTSNAAIVVSSDRVPNGTITFTTTTFNGTATDGSDYNGALTSGITFDSTNCAVGPALPCARTVNVPIRGDLINEGDETFVLQLSAVNGTNASAGNASITVTITNDDTVPQLTIAQIQGDGSATPVAAAPNNVVTTLGNVVTAKQNNGFYIQMPVGDGDVETSDAIFVFTNTGHPMLPIIAVGDLVDVNGPVVEFFGLTEFTTAAGLPIVNIVGTAAVPAPIVLGGMIPSPDGLVPYCDPDNNYNVDAGDGQFAPANLPSAAGDTALVRNWECLEAMHVEAVSATVSAPNDPNAFATEAGRFTEVYLNIGNGRAFREQGITADASVENVTLPAITPPAPALPSQIWDGNPNIVQLDPDRINQPDAFYPPGSTISTRAILGFEFGTASFPHYELWPITPIVPGGTPVVLPTAVPLAGTDQITIGSQNVLRLFDDVNDSYTADDCATQGTADVCPTTIQFTNKLSKLSMYIRDVLRAPMIVAVEEVENINALSQLAAKLTTDLAGGGTYTALMGSDQDNDFGHINTGYLVRENVSVVSTEAKRTSETWVFNGTVEGEIFDRPPYLLVADVTVDGNTRRVATLALHLRSLTGTDDLSPAADHRDAHRIRQKRFYGATRVACDVQQFQTANPSVPLVVLGDLNAYEFSDGYADIVGIIRGDTVASDAEYNLAFDPTVAGSPVVPPECTLTGNQIVAPALVEGMYAQPSSEHYSYNFRGTVQELDHALLSTAAVARFEGFSYGRGNSDAPANLNSDFGTPLRASDHDGLVIYLNAGPDATENGFGLLKDGFE